MTNGRPTIKEVAAAAGLSINTISRVVNGRPNVAPATAKKAMEAITKLGYRPNLVARSLRLGRDNTLGIAVTSITDPFFAEVVSAVEETARGHGFSAIISCTGESDGAEEGIVSGLLNRQVAGIIVRTRRERTRATSLASTRASRSSAWTARR